MRASLLWKYRFAGEVRLLLSSDDCVLLLSDGELRCLSPGSGSVKWSLKGVREASILKDRVLALSDGLTCLSIEEGKEVWSLKEVERFAVDEGGGRICASSGRTVTCLNPDGTTRWSYEVPSEVKAIAVSGGHAYLACEDGFLYCLKEHESSLGVRPLAKFVPPQEETTAFEGGWVPSELL